MKVITLSGECQPLAELRPRSEHRDTGFMALLPVYGTRPFPPKFPQHRKTKAPRPGRGADKSKSAKAALFELFGDHGKLQLGLGEGLDDHPLGAFGGGVLGGSHFADEQVLCALEHFLFAEGEGLAAAEGNEALEDGGDFNERPRAHALGVLLEAMLPVRMRVEFALFEEAQDFHGFIRANDGTKANRACVGLRHHHTQSARNNADHVVTLGSTVQDTVVDLFNNAYTVIRVNDLVADLIVHNFWMPPRAAKSV